MHVHVPEAGDHEISAGIDELRVLRHSRFAGFADGLNAIAFEDDGAVG
jgi:hypothetical protein